MITLAPVVINQAVSFLRYRHEHGADTPSSVISEDVLSHVNCPLTWQMSCVNSHFNSLSWKLIPLEWGYRRTQREIILRDVYKHKEKSSFIYATPEPLLLQSTCSISTLYSHNVNMLLWLIPNDLDRFLTQKNTWQRPNAALALMHFWIMSCCWSRAGHYGDIMSLSWYLNKCLLFLILKAVKTTLV